MRLAKRPRVRTAGGLAVLCTAFVAMLAVSAGGAAAATHTAKGSTSTTYASQATTVSRLNSFTQLPHGIQPDQAFLACQGMTELLPTGSCTLAPPKDEGAQLDSRHGAPNVYGSHLGKYSGNLGSNFNGISDVLQRTRRATTSPRPTRRSAWARPERSRAAESPWAFRAAGPSSSRWSTTGGRSTRRAARCSGSTATQTSSATRTPPATSSATTTRRRTRSSSPRSVP